VLTVRGVLDRGELVVEASWWFTKVVGREKWNSTLAGTRDAWVITVVGEQKVKIGDTTASGFELPQGVIFPPFGLLPLPKDEKSEFPPNDGISKVGLGPPSVAAFFLVSSTFSTSSNGLLFFLLLFSSLSTSFSTFSLSSVSIPLAPPTPLVTGVGAARLNTGKVVIGRGFDRDMAGGSGRPELKGSRGLDRDTGARPLSTTLDLSLREDLVEGGRLAAGGGVGAGLG